MPEEWQPAWKSSIESPIAIHREEIGGWLFLFCVANSILGPLNLLRSISASATTYWTVTYIVLAILTMAAGVTTWMRAKSAFTFIRLAFIAWLLYATLQLHFAVQLQKLPETSNFASKEFVGAARSTAHVIVWFWYFKVSTRVANTFGRNI